MSRIFAAVMLCCMIPVQVSLTHARDMANPVERKFPQSVAAVQAALQNLAGTSGGRLPSLEGFIHLDRVRIDDYAHPYFEFKTSTESDNDGQTIVRVRAHVSAWYVGPDSSISGYRNLESNGRLENDLLDRLADYLRTKSTDPSDLNRQIAELRQQRLQVEERIALLEAHLAQQHSEVAQPDLILVSKPRVAIVGAPNDQGAVLLHPQIDDEFEVQEKRGAWLRVKLEESRSGWIRRSQVDELTPTSRENAKAAQPMNLDTFTIIRENAADFSGDWPRLKGKKVLYVWVRPIGSSLNVAANKMRFAQSTFERRYREITHSSQNDIDGIVLIFLDQQGGVAAAAVDDIGTWLNGSISPVAFRKKCSFDPASAFDGQTSSTLSSRTLADLNGR